MLLNVLITSLSVRLIQKVLKIRLDSTMVDRGDEARDLFVLDLARRLNGVNGEQPYLVRDLYFSVWTMTAYHPRPSYSW